MNGEILGMIALLLELGATDDELDPMIARMAGRKPPKTCLETLRQLRAELADLRRERTHATRPWRE